VGQMLTGLRMELGSIARVLGNAEGEVSSRIARAKGTVEQTLRIVRDIAMLLRPSMLDNLGLVPALAWLFKEVSRSSGIEIHSNIDPALDKLPDIHRTCIYRIVQEALTNVSRHSTARTVDVSIRRAEDQVIGFVVDDGRGFDRAGQKRGGLGLLGMEERVREVGGSVEVGSSPGKGTQIEFRLPWPESTEVMSDTGTGSGRSRHRSDGLKASA